MINEVKPSVNCGTGLTFNKTQSELSQQVDRLNGKFENIAAGAAITTGSVAGAATVAGGTTLAVLTGAESVGLFLLGLFGGIFGWIVTAPLVGGITFGIVELTRWKKEKNLKLLKDELQSQYEETGLVAKKDIIRLLQKTDKVCQQNLISAMNFEQLSAAKQAVGERRFKQLISSVDQEQHKQWLTILSLTEKTDSEELVMKLKSRDFKQISKANPHFANELQERLKTTENPEVCAILHNYWLSSLDGASRSGDPTIQVTINNRETLVVNTRLLEEYTGLKLPPNGVLRYDNVIAPETFKLCLKLLSHYNHGKIELDKNQVIELCQYARFFNAPKLLRALENYMMNHQASFFEHDIEAIIVSCPEFTRLKTRIEDFHLNQKPTRENWIYLANKAKAIESDRLKEKCLAYAQEQIHEALTTHAVPIRDTLFWFKHYQQTAGIKSDTYQIFREALIKKQAIKTIRQLYELAVQGNDEVLHESCLAFFRSHIQSIKDQAVWKIGTTPDEVSEILYPEEV